ncbi:capsular biosynthesis protein [Burkholderia cenocepacia]|uniref:capsular polysaccharide export protein, LipB/KpsS family n=1 Tax=Burkholderia cenocepacia TaxID=95486 RepID=UPI00209D2CCC|nr:capsular biosynthesis protein [Burkholderia cenocepacia]MCO8322932.1 capsular biosynthesis protein [Burkholderia cenocepacia]MCO8330446.1 capsular biosynthesis protein [Burkholderia cenocepacia]MCO8337731.1 capsular biosynthesis protein [Burkholderia cenocepacia]MCO8344787.1 capsular biosynthesis protein [Burkholderia cenocepacia]MCO8358070.1 capsular biosynthesis protein [Burkholderia cenocepacia]
MSIRMRDDRIHDLQVWPNGLIPRATGPALSWFAAPLPNATMPAWRACIDIQLTARQSAHGNITALMERFRDARPFDRIDTVSRPHPGLLDASPVPRILLIDEPVVTHLDRNAKERKRQFARMVTAAYAAHPGAQFWFARSSAHTGRKWLAEHHPDWLTSPRYIDIHGSICSALQHVDAIYTVSAPEGIQALLHGIPVHVFGTPWYAGWGHTHDHVDQTGNRADVTLEALFDTVFVRLSRHLDPTTHEYGSLDALLNGIETHRATASRFADLKKVAAVRFQWWKRPFATPYLTAGGGTLRWVDNTQQVQPGELAAFWGARSPEGLSPGKPTIRIEDGFLHSTGLGSDHVAPLSQVIDRRGLYFDAGSPSDLTEILNEAAFDASELARAKALRHEITRLGLTKYNLGRRKPRWRAPPEKRIVLVPGQVADDASIRLGTRSISTVEQLLREVRTRRPDTFVVYKPHPDVLSGNRRGLIEAEGLADIVDTSADLISLIEAADEIHTLSSLSGFDALIRGKAVHTYGLPFYAGWGLTDDTLKQPWRKRQLSLDMLVAGALLRYPLYWDWSLNLFTTPEAIVRQLAIPAARPLETIHRNRLRLLIKTLRWSRNGIHHLAWRLKRK